MELAVNLVRSSPFCGVYWIREANEFVRNVVGGMSGSYSNLARFPGTTNYVFAWQSRGAINLTPDDW